jgi:hypothetical protein
MASGILSSESGSITIPAGTTAERPSVPAEGMFRYNTTLTAFEYYNGTTWVQINFPIVG